MEPTSTIWPNEEYSFKEALALHWVFLSFGIPPEDIWVSYAERRFQVVARQGAREFRVDVADLSLEKEDFSAKWRAVVDAFNVASDEERLKIIEKTQSRIDAVMIMAGLIDKGFERAPVLN
jgi:hypothetical protein